MTSPQEQEIETFRRRTGRSAEVFKATEKSTPFGVHSNYRFVDPYPLYFKIGRGSRAWDADENEYIDFNMAFGALVTGHTHPLLQKAIMQRIADGTILGFEFEDSYKLADIICERFRVEQLRFSSTGLEATHHALRFARAFTGRNKILKFEGCFDGSHDYLLVSVKPSVDKAGDPRRPRKVPSSPGIPPEVIAATEVAPFNDLEATRRILEQNKRDIAAVILEPVPMNMGFVLPRRDFLQGLRELCDQTGALLIFDEVKTSGKYFRGATGRFNVAPDMMVMGKAIAGGYPLSVIAGTKDIMSKIGPGKVAHSGTFNSNPVSVTAGIVTLRQILTIEGLNRAAKLGESLSSGYSKILDKKAIRARIQWDGISGAVMYTDEEVVDWRAFLRCDVGKWWLYYIAMINRGIIPASPGPDEQWTVSVQHTEQDMKRHLEIFEEISGLVREKYIEMPVVESI